MPLCEARAVNSTRLDALRALKRRLRRAARAALGSVRDHLAAGGWSPEPILVPVPVRASQHRPLRRGF
jgi:hypothetical protein